MSICGDRLTNHNCKVTSRGEQAYFKKLISKEVISIFVTSRWKPTGCEMSRLKRLLENWLIDGSEISALRSENPLPQ
jgi:hypothetical protein